MTQISLLKALEKWYLSQCDKDWEHMYGVTIDTLDNPGWRITIDLCGTGLEQKRFETVNIESSNTNWIQCNVSGSKFIGAGGPENLEDIILIFLNWVNES